MHNSKEQFVVNHSEGSSLVELCYTGNNFADLYVDDKLIDRIKIVHFLNFEYTFNVREKQCSIVKLVTDKTIGFVVDGKYQNKDRNYAPITKTPILTWIVLSIDLIVLIIYAIYVFQIDSIRLDGKLLLVVEFTMFSFILTYFIRVVCNSPCVIKNPTHNLMFRCFLIIVTEIIFAFVAFGMFSWANILS